MSRPAAHLKRIVNQIVVELLKIKKVDGYGTDITASQISKQPAEWFSFRTTPCICVVYSSGSNEYGPHHSQQITKRVQLYIRFRDKGSVDVVDQISELDEDIDYLIEQNPTLIEAATGDELVTNWLRDNDDSDKGALSIEEKALWRVNLKVIYHKDNS